MQIARRLPWQFLPNHTTSLVDRVSGRLLLAWLESQWCGFPAEVRDTTWPPATHAFLRCTTLRYSKSAEREATVYLWPISCHLRSGPAMLDVNARGLFQLLGRRVRTVFALGHGFRASIYERYLSVLGTDISSLALTRPGPNQLLACFQGWRITSQEPQAPAVVATPRLCCYTIDRLKLLFFHAFGIQDC